MEKWIDIHRISYYTGRFRRQHPCVSEGPSFTVPITNVTIPMGREAVLTCVVANLSIYKVNFPLTMSLNLSHVYPFSPSFSSPQNYIAWLDSDRMEITFYTIFISRSFILRR